MVWIQESIDHNMWRVKCVSGLRCHFYATYILFFTKVKLGIGNNVLTICVILFDKGIITQAMSWIT
jgi:hypothetical protein